MDFDCFTVAQLFVLTFFSSSVIPESFPSLFDFNVVYGSLATNILFCSVFLAYVLLLFTIETSNLQY